MPLGEKAELVGSPIVVGQCQNLTGTECGLLYLAYGGLEVFKRLDRLPIASKASRIEILKARVLELRDSAA